ncbi:SpaA isopeptide-forming pilin-related protein [Candidatus Avoscillospira sp. LCP25S3_F1]|uniref:MSCRAMM family protein n=1 Tax=Candidatus Avoscillospira sp. LCP25S3_F1 TaxID=3438825 RepID=UPI003F8E6AE7
MIQTSEKTRFTEAEMATVRDTDLPDLLISLGYQVKRIGRYYTTQEMDSIRIKDRRTWFRYSEGIGGDAITFLQRFYNKSFPEAVEYLLTWHGRARDSPPVSTPRQTKEKEEKVPFKDGFLLDDTPQTVQVKEGQTVTVEFRNQPMGNLIIHKLSSKDKTPLKGVQFKITYADGTYLPDEGGKLSSNGLYWTNAEGQIILSGITGTVVVTEVESIPGYTIDPNTQSQTLVVNPDDTQQLYFYNAPVGGVEFTKVNEADKTETISGVTFEIRRVSDDALVDTVTTGKDGKVFLPLEADNYYAVETDCPDTFKLDPTPIYFTVKDGETTRKTVTNKAFSGILLHKIDAATRKGIYGVTFLLYDGNMNPVDQFTTDQNGYAYASILREKTAAVKVAGGSTAEKILQLEEREGYLMSQKQELQEALDAGSAALSCADQILSELDSAEGWGTWDLVGGGLITDLVKHSHLDEAQASVETLQTQLRRFKTELADVTIDADIQVSIDGFLRVADYFFDGIFADWAVLDQIHQSQEQVHQTRSQICGVLDHLQALMEQTEADTTSISLEVEQLVASVSM